MNKVSCPSCAKESVVTPTHIDDVNQVECLCGFTYTITVDYQVTGCIRSFECEHCGEYVELKNSQIHECRSES